MKAMILAAGRGTRLKELGRHTPKPLITVGDRAVIEHTLAALADQGFREIVINAHHLAERLMERVGDGSRWGVRVTWSAEDVLMNTGGGIRQALPLLGHDPFLTVNGDILWETALTSLTAVFAPGVMDGLLGLVPNPPDGLGDFLLAADGRLTRASPGLPGALTYSGIQVLRPGALSPYPVSPFPLNRFHDDVIAAGRLHGRLLPGRWADMGTPERLERARRDWAGG
ncbi:MAG: nucleotidyltransferase family protein [Magnetococcales bacterium]|nr:nucleotidyltransferase family protein [Magnetococcales bacterium]